MSDGAMHFGDYGKQRGWVRVGSSQEIPDKADSDGRVSGISVREQLVAKYKQVSSAS